MTEIEKQIIDALEPGDTVEYKKEQLDKVAGKMSQTRSLEFSRYLTSRFIMAIKSQPVAQMVAKWDVLSEDEKMTLVQKLIDTLLEIIISDVDNNNVTIYKADGTELGDIGSHARAVYKEDIKAPNIKIDSVDAKGFQMGVSPTGRLSINFQLPIYGTVDFLLMDLRHEASHIVDMFLTPISPLPPEVSRASFHNYIQPEDDAKYYVNNQAELNAETGRTEYAAEIRQAVKDVKAGQTIVLPKHTRPTIREAVMLEVLNEVHNNTKRAIEENRKRLPDKVYGGIEDKDVFIDRLLKSLDEKKKNLLDSMGTYVGMPADNWKFKVSSEYAMPLMISDAERHGGSPDLSKVISTERY